MHEQSTSKAKSSKICSICILPQSKNYAKITVLKAATAKGLRFSVLKYFVLAFCSHSEVASVVLAVFVSRVAVAPIMHRGLWNMDHASFFTEATLTEIGVYS